MKKFYALDQTRFTGKMILFVCILIAGYPVTAYMVTPDAGCKSIEYCIREQVPFLYQNDALVRKDMYYLSQYLKNNKKDETAFRQCVNMFSSSFKDPDAMHEVQKKLQKLHSRLRNPILFHQLLHVLILQEKFNKAQKLYELHKDTYSHSIFLFETYAFLDQKNNDLDSARQHLELILEQYPYATAIMNKIGVIFMSMKEYDRAEKIFNDIIRMEPANVEGYIALASIYPHGKMNREELTDMLNRIIPGVEQQLESLIRHKQKIENLD